MGYGGLMDITTYGLEVERSEYHPRRDLIGGIDRTPSGNIVLRVGRELGTGQGWESTGHIVMTTPEVGAFIESLRSALN
jgi:hypothetical protein